MGSLGLKAGLFLKVESFYSIILVGKITLWVKSWIIFPKLQAFIQFF